MHLFGIDDLVIWGMKRRSTIMGTEANLQAAAQTVVETGKTKAGRLGYILVFALGIFLGFMIKWFI